MNLTKLAVDHRPVTLVLVVLLLFVGASTFLTMSRRENPRITIRSAVVETSWPGASAEKVEDLVTELLEDAIYGIEEVKTLESMSRMGSSRIDIELEDTVSGEEIDQVWDKLRDRVTVAQAGLPTGCATPFVNSDFGDVSSVCLVLHGRPEPGGAEPYSYRDLEQMADKLERALKTIPSVGSVTTYGIPDETISLEVDAGTWAKLGISAEELSQSLDDRNVPNTGTVLVTERQRLPLRTTGEFVTTADLGDVLVTTAEDGRAVPLRELPIEIRRSHEEPRSSAIRYVAAGVTAPRSVLLGIAMKEGKNVVSLGEEVDRVVEEFSDLYLPEDVGVRRVNDLPRQVDVLVSDFMESLWQAILIVLAVAFLMMGWRPALVMATAIPLSMISTIGMMPRFGVELEQFAIASLIIVLGMVVDNAIVVTDNVQQLLDKGVPRERASIEGANGLSRAILSSTLTTVGAFVPMLTIIGAAGEYVRSLPIVVSATLLSSYLIAMTVTPLMCSWLLRPSKSGDESTSRFGAIYTKVVRACVRLRVVTVGVTALALAGSISLMPSIGTQFFPGGIRDQFFIDVNLPVGASLEATERVVAQLEDLLVETSETSIEGEPMERLVSVTSFVGTGGPRLMLTSDPKHAATYRATMLVNTADPTLSRPWIAELQGAIKGIAGARIGVRAYALGPPIEDPVQFRFSGPDLQVLRSAGEQILAELEQTEGLLSPAHDWGELAMELDLDVDSDRAYLAGVSSGEISSTLQGLYSGTRLTTLREGDHGVGVTLRLLEAQRRSVDSLEQVYVDGGAGHVPLTSIASVNPGWEPGVIARRNRERTLTIGAQIVPGVLANDRVAAILPRIEPIVEALPQGYSLEVGGELEETAEGQGSIMGALKISVVLIFLVLLVQYNSLLKPVVVLLAFPMSLIGALIGLYVTGWPLGFMPMLGIVALAGTVINNAIVLIDFIEGEVAGGADLRAAVATAGLARMKPILLTTLTTVGGLLPLALFGGPMWAGMSWAMIFGLLLSTAMTLLVIPTVYVWFADRFGMQVAS